MEGEAGKHGAEIVRIEDGLRAQLPLVRLKPRRLTEWLRELPFHDLRAIELHVVETELAFHLVVSARTSFLVPLGATVTAYVIATGFGHLAPILSPLIGFAVGFATWAYQWLRFSVGVQAVVDRCAAALIAGGA